MAYRAELIVERYLHGVRIDTFLVKHFRNYTSFRMQRMVRAGLVKIEQRLAPLDRRVHAGERVAIRLIEPPDKLLESEPLPLSVLYEDPWLLVVDKPAGQIAHPVGDKQTGTLCNAVQHHLDRQTPVRGLLRPGIVHRLDRETSGVMVIPKEHAAHRALSIDFQRGRVSKTYLALLEGRVTEDAGMIDRPLGLLPGGGSVLMSAAPDARRPKPARTRYDVVERFRDATLVLATPLTGRLHQIRVHFAASGHPVFGDAYYGPFGTLRPDAPGVAASDGPASSRQRRHALHAWQIEFRHPLTGEMLRHRSSPPQDFRRLLTERGAIGAIARVVTAGRASFSANDWP